MNTFVKFLKNEKTTCQKQGHTWECVGGENKRFRMCMLCGLTKKECD